MKLSILFIGFVATTLSIQSMASEKKIDAKLTNATIYYQGAELTYQQSVLLSRGENEILLSGLSPYVDQNSIRISTSKFAIVNAFEYKIDYLTTTPESKSVKIWQDSLNICNAKIAELNDNITNNQNVLTLLNVNTSGNSEGNINFTALMSYADYYKTKGAQLMTELRNFNKDKQNLSEITARLQQQINSETSKNKRQGVLYIKINSSSAKSSDLKVVYYTQSASWSPYYDISVANTSSPLSLQSKATVKQYTGLDWDNVHIKLTTSRPTFSNTAPTLHIWFVNFLPQPTPTLAFGMSRSAKLASPMENAEIFADRPVELKEEISMDDYIEQASNDVSQSFDISLPYTIAGNGGPQYIDLLDKSIKAEYVYYTIPKLSEEAYIVAELADWETLDIMSGNANVNFDGTYMGSTYINTNTTEAKMPITLGIDTRISVKREKVQDYSSKKTLGNNIVQTFTYNTTIKNNQTQKIKMTTKDQYPVSNNKSITVNLLKDTTMPTQDNTKTGELIWAYDLNPGETKVLTTSFSIQYPKGQPINF